MADVLSDVLRSVRLRGGVFLDARFTAPWAVNSIMTAEACKPLLSRPSHLIGYHMIIEGELVVSVADLPPVSLHAGDIVIMPRNDMQTLGSAPGLTPVDGRSFVEPSPDGGLTRVSYGGGGKQVRMFCGFLGCEDSYNPLIATLPRILTIDMREATSKELVETTLKFAASELIQGRLAESSIISRLSEFLLIEAVRRYADNFSEQHTGWLRGLRDPAIGRALALLHQDIAVSWTVEALAREVAMLRSAFTERFASLIGVPPMTYLASWRMETAKIQLRESTKSVAQVAYGIGYESEEAFSRAFKRSVGVSPSVWRDESDRGSPVLGPLTGEGARA